MKSSLLWLLKLNVTENIRPIQLKTKNKKTTHISLLGFFILLFICLFLYIFFISRSVIELGYGKMLPTIMISVLTMCIFIFNLLKSGWIIFFSKDIDFLMSLPIKTELLVISKILTIYILDVFTALGFILPMITSLLIYEKAYSISYLFTLFISVFFIPLIPIVLSTFFNIVTFRISSKFRLNNIVNTFLNLILLIMPIFVIAAVQYKAIDLQKILNVFSNNLIFRCFIPFPAHAADMLMFLLSCITCTLIFVIFVYIISFDYKRILTLLNTSKVVASRAPSELKTNSDLKALYKKEILRYFSSTSYFLNTAIFAIMLILLSFATLFISPEQMEIVLDIPNFSVWISKFTPLLSSTLVVLTCTTAVSLSLEGKNIWILRTIPVSNLKIYMSKILVNLSVTVPSLIVSNIILIAKLNINFIDSVLMFIVPIIFTLFSSVLGIVINLRFPNYEWKSEVTVIKQSLSVALALLCNAVSVAILIGAILLIDFIDWHVIMISYSCILAFITTRLYRRMQRLSF